jgi:hypothetical protein
MKKSEVLKLMNDIMEKMPLDLDYASDARDIWPARWNELYNQIEAYPNGITNNPAPCMFCGGVETHKTTCKRHPST